MPKVNIDIYAKTHGSEEKIRDVDKSLDKLHGSAGKSDSKLKGLWKQFAAGILVTQGLSTAIRGLNSFIRGSITEAGNQETAENNLRVALESTGREVNNNVEHFKTYAQELQNNTTYADDAVMAAQALLIQLTDLDNEGLDAATEGALGLASTFNIDLQSATNLVAKALTGNYGALSRYGISVNDLNTDEEKRAELLDRLGTLYSRAKGETNTYQGAMKQLKNVFGDLKEELGNAIIKNEDFIELIKDTKDKLKTLIESGKIKEWAEAAVTAITKLFGALGTLKDTIGAIVTGGYLGLIDKMTNKIIGMDKKFQDLESEMIAKAIEFKNSLKVLKPSMSEIRTEFEKGEKSRKAWIADMIEMDTRLAENKNKYVELGDQIFTFLGLKGREKTAVDDVKKAIDDNKQAAIDIIPPLEDWETQMAEVEQAYKDTQAEVQKNSEYINNIAIPTVKGIAGNYASATADMKSSTHDVGEANEAVTTNIRTWWTDLSEGIKTKFSTELGEMLTGAQDFGTTINELVTGIKDHFLKMIADMATEWIFGFLKDLTTSTAKAGEGIKGSLGTAVGSISEGMKSLSSLNPSGIVAGAIAGVVGGLLSGLMGNKGLSAKGMNEHLYRIHDRLQEIKDFIFIDIRTWVIQAWTTLFNIQHSEIMGKMTSLQILGQNRNAILRSIRRLLKDQLLGLVAAQANDLRGLYKLFSENIQFGQRGLDTTVNRPTMFMAGERGQERVTITPHGGVSRSPMNITFNIQAWDGHDVRRVLENDGRRILEDIFRRNTGGLTRRLAFETRKY